MDLFHRYYDLLFVKKDYRKETDVLFNIAVDLGIDPVRRLLEIGCGTGNHTFEMAESEVKITAVDTDPGMIEVAKNKARELGIENVDFHLGDLRELDKKGFDLAAALFNVVSYITDLDQLISFFEAVQERLSDHGVFVFDCWNGIAAVKDPPGSKQTSGFDGDLKIECHLTSRTEFMRQITTLQYQFTVKDASGKEVQRDSYSFDQYLWTPDQIKYALHKAGLKVVTCSPIFQPELTATAEDWKIMFVCMNDK